MMNTDELRYLVLASVAGAALGWYHLSESHHSVRLYLSRHDRRMYWVHNGCYMMLWVAFTTNARALATPLLLRGAAALVAMA